MVRVLRSQDCLFLEISKHSYFQLDQKRMLLPYLVSWLFLNESPDISCEPSRYVSQRTVYLLLQVQCTHAEVQKRRKKNIFGRWIDIEYFLIENDILFYFYFFMKIWGTCQLSAMYFSCLVQVYIYIYIYIDSTS